MTNWIQTYTGRKFDLDKPDASMVGLEDIAHALSQICRYTGHSNRFYSVAQHSVLVSRQLPPELMAEGLMHDAQEAYVGDVSSPLKRSMRRGRPSEYDLMEASIRRVVTERFGLKSLTPDEVKTADIRMLMTEASFLLGETPGDWGFDVEPYPITVIPWDSWAARHCFLTAARELGVS